MKAVAGQVQGHSAGLDPRGTQPTSSCQKAGSTSLINAEHPVWATDSSEVRNGSTRPLTSLGLSIEANVLVRKEAMSPSRMATNTFMGISFSARVAIATDLLPQAIRQKKKIELLGAGDVVIAPPQGAAWLHSAACRSWTNLD